jgi:hypothetical protein
MLYDLVSFNHDRLASHARQGFPAASRVSGPSAEPEVGIPLFLTQLSEALRLGTIGHPFSASAIDASAARYGRDLLAGGWTLSEVVQDYGDVGDAITQLAIEQRASISPGELHTLSRCLDTAIAGAVTEYARLKEEATSRRDLDRRVRIAHDLRNVVQTAMLSFQVLKGDPAAASGPTGALLGRSLAKIRDLVDGIAAEERPAERVAS